MCIFFNLSNLPGISSLIILLSRLLVTVNCFSFLNNFLIILKNMGRIVDKIVRKEYY